MELIAFHFNSIIIALKLNSREMLFEIAFHCNCFLNFLISSDITPRYRLQKVWTDIDNKKN